MLGRERLERCGSTAYHIGLYVGVFVHSVSIERQEGCRTDGEIQDWTKLSQWQEPSQSAATREWRRRVFTGPVQLLKAGSALIEQAVAPQRIFLLQSGIVKLSHTTVSGQAIAIMLRVPGDLVGMYGVLLGLPPFVSAQCLTDCSVIGNPVSGVMTRLDSDSEVAVFLARRQTVVDAARLQSLLIEARVLTAEQRLFRLLLQIATALVPEQSRRTTVSVTVPFAEACLADLLAMNRTAFSRLKRQLLNDQRLHQDRMTFTFQRQLAEGDLFT